MHYRITPSDNYMAILHVDLADMPDSNLEAFRGYVDDKLETYFMLHGLILMGDNQTKKHLEHAGFVFTDTVVLNGLEYLKFHKCNPEFEGDSYGE